MNFLIRFFSFLFLTPLTLFLLAIGLFALAQGVNNLNIDMLPWTGKSLNNWLTGLSAAGLFSIYLALRKKLRILYVFYALAVLYLSVNAVFLSGHRFDGLRDFQWGIAFVAGCFLAAIGAILQSRK